ncbi:MAG: class I SAM-dependent methyltransferase [Alphaproteobacteria bacterium]|uniref:Class I SAM-dependent methyltransferase n=1 Tax=Candidatus Nitrobium versatile TaxID=2884831 RepID=A0A953M0X7_9BACT|nr:class I SAM-dependent methyltransferase [Candidatus Nitrobium versatile]
MTTSGIRCRFCGSPLSDTFADLGVSPLANSYLKQDQLLRMEPFYPLHVYVCPSCFLVQLPVFEAPEEIFSDYAYFSSYSDSWLAHARRYTEMMVERFGLAACHYVVEIASNDGYLLQYFRGKGIPVLGIEPARNVAEAARKKGIPTLTEFFGAKKAEALSTGGQRADLLIGNNVLAHVPGLTDFVEGMKIFLKPYGIITMEFPHLMRLMEENQFDTIYHEHFSYFSFLTVEKVFARYGLTLFDVEELPTHGGSLRIYARHAEDATKPVGERVEELRERERGAGFDRMECYRSFGEKVREAKRAILDFMVRAKRDGKTIAGYGAPAKGNTILNYCGIRTDFIDYTVDRSPYKQNHYLPGSRIPIYHPERVRETRPDYLLILPWNLKDEVMEQMAHIREWGGKFVTFIPEVNIQ